MSEDKLRVAAKALGITLAAALFFYFVFPGFILGAIASTGYLGNSTIDKAFPPSLT